MLLTCPQYETIFRVDRFRLHLAVQPVQCMICDHIRTARLLTSGDRSDLRWVNNIAYIKPSVQTPIFD